MTDWPDTSDHQTRMIPKVQVVRQTLGYITLECKRGAVGPEPQTYKHLAYGHRQLRNVKRTTEQIDTFKRKPM